jgi:hypothetical protein
MPSDPAWGPYNVGAGCEEVEDLADARASFPPHDGPFTGRLFPDTADELPLVLGHMPYAPPPVMFPVKSTNPDAVFCPVPAFPENTPPSSKTGPVVGRVAPVSNGGASASMESGGAPLSPSWESGSPFTNLK